MVPNMQDRAYAAHIFGDYRPATRRGRVLGVLAAEFAMDIRLRSFQRALAVAELALQMSHDARWLGAKGAAEVLIDIHAEKG